MRIIILSGACKSGKSYLLKKVKKDLRGYRVTLYDMDALQYWDERVMQEINFDWKEAIEGISCDEGVRKKMELNLKKSLPWERLVKQKTITLLTKGENSLIINVLDRTKKSDKFYDILSALFNVKLHFIAIIPSYGRYCLNLYKRKDKKTYSQTWGMRKSIEGRKEIFDEILTNDLLFGIRFARKRLVNLLSSS